MGDREAADTAGDSPKRTLTRPGSDVRAKGSRSMDAIRQRLGLTAEVPAPPMAEKVVRLVGGKEKVFQYLRSSDNEAVQKMVELWDSIPVYDRSRLKVWEVAAAAGVKWSRVTGELTCVAQEHHYDVSNLIAAIAHPAVVEKQVKFAMKEKGVKDRQMLHQHANFIPIPKGTTIINKFQQLNQNQIVPPTDEHELPAFETDSVLLAKSLRGEPLLLEGGKVEK
jgi:hypothetical protein